MPFVESAFAFINNLAGIIGTGCSIYDFFKNKGNEEIIAIRKKSEEAFVLYCEIRIYRGNVIGEPIKNKVIGYWESCLKRNVLPTVKDISDLKIAEKEEAELLFKLLVDSWMELPFYVEWLNALEAIKASTELKEQLSIIKTQIELFQKIPHEIDKIQILNGLVTNITKERIFDAQKKCSQEDIKHFYTVDNRFETMLRVISSKNDIPHDKAANKLFNLLENGNNVIISGNGGQGKTSLMMHAAVHMSYMGYIVLWMNLSANEVISEQIAGHFIDILQNSNLGNQRILLCIDNPFEGKLSLANIRERWPSDSKIQLIMAERSNRLSLLADTDLDVLLYWFDKAKLLLLQGINQEKPMFILKNYERFPFAESYERRKRILEKSIYGFFEPDEKGNFNIEIRDIAHSTMNKHTNPKISLVELIYHAAFELQNSITKACKVKLDWNEWGDFLKREFRCIEDESDISLYSIIAATKFFGFSLPVTIYCRYFGLLESTFKNRLKERMVTLHIEPVIYKQNTDTLQPKHDVIADLFFQFNKNKVQFNEVMLSLIHIMHEEELDILLSHMVYKNDMRERKNWAIGEIQYWRYMDEIYKRLKNNELDLSTESRAYLCLGFLWSRRIENYKDNKVIKEVLELCAPEIDETVTVAKLYTEWGIWANQFGDFQLAEEKFKCVIEKNNTSIPPRTELGKLLFKQNGREKEAEKYLLEVLAINSEDYMARTELGKLLSNQKGREKEAEKYLLEAIKIEPNNIHSYTELGRLLSKKRGREAEAEKYLLMGRKISIKDPMVRTELGRLLSKQKGREKEAENYLLEALRIDQYNIHSYTELGRLLTKQKGREKEAERHLLKAINIAPRNLPTYTELGRLLSKQKGREEDAEKYLLEALKIDPKNLHPHTEMGRLLSKQKGREKEAEKYLLEVIKIDPKNIMTRTELGRLLSKQKGREKEAEKYLLEAIQIVPKNLPTHTELGRLLSKQKGREKEAEMYLLEAIKIDPKNLHPHTELGRLLSKQKGREEEAEKYLLKVLDMDSKNVIARTELGKLLVKQKGREEEAEKYLLEAINIDQNSLHARAVLANLYEKYDSAKALEIYREICDIESNDKYGIDGLKRLE